MNRSIKFLFAALASTALSAGAFAGVDGTYNAADGYTNVTSLNFQLDSGKMVKDPGTLAWRVDAQGNVLVAFVEPLSINDNTYGTNSIGWGSKSHTFGNLTGSDKGHFDFFNGAGTNVFSFDLDYISSAKVNNVTTYTSLGATGGDGKVAKGNSAWLLDWGTSLDYNFNTLGYTQYTTNSPAATPHLDANGDIDYSQTYMNSAAPGWDYYITYEVMVSKDAFGPSGFGSVSVPYAHNSPSKLGQNTIVVVVPEMSALFPLVGLAIAVGSTHVLRRRSLARKNVSA